MPPSAAFRARDDDGDDAADDGAGTGRRIADEAPMTRRPARALKRSSIGRACREFEREQLAIVREQNVLLFWWGNERILIGD
jgi:hypothetical protein